MWPFKKKSVPKVVPVATKKVTQRLDDYQKYKWEITVVTKKGDKHVITVEVPFTSDTVYKDLVTGDSIYYSPHEGPKVLVVCGWFQLTNLDCLDMGMRALNLKDANGVEYSFNTDDVSYVTKEKIPAGIVQLGVDILVDV